MKLSNHFFDRVAGILLVCAGWTSHAIADVEFKEKIAVYGVVKPGAVTTMLAVNHGIVSRIPFMVGQSVERGSVVIEVMEKETTRAYRTAIKGGVAKFHVTSGASVAPGMPLSTIMDPDQKLIEISLSPQEATKVKEGAEVGLKAMANRFGVVERVSPLVDPDTGSVLAYVKPDQPVERLIGDVLPLDIVLRVHTDCKITSLREVDSFLDEYDLIAVSDKSACLKKRKR